MSRLEFELNPEAVRTLAEIRKATAATPAHELAKRVRLFEGQLVDRTVPGLSLVAFTGQQLWDEKGKLIQTGRWIDPSPTSDPPLRASYLLALIARPGRADELLGDAESEYRKMVARFGLKRARWRYRVYVAWVIVGMVPGVLMRAMVLHKLLSSF
jgi:hypothetical protein